MFVCQDFVDTGPARHSDSEKYLAGASGEGPGFVGGGRVNEPMTESPLATAQRLCAQAVDALRGVVEAGSADERVAVLTLCEATARQLDQVTVATVAGLEREGVFTERGYRSPTQALSDLIGWEGREAHRRVVAAEQITARVGLDGSVLPARLPATAAVFTAGRTGLRHVEVIARLLNSKAAGWLSPRAKHISKIIQN